MTPGDENDDKLDDAVAAAVRAVPPVDATTREAHITTALDALGTLVPSRSGTAPSRRWLATAAAVALAAGFGLGRLGGDTDTRTRNATIETTNTTTQPKGSTPCGTTDGAEVIGEYSTAEGDRTIVLTDGAILILDSVTCETIESIPLP